MSIDPGVVYDPAGPKGASLAAQPLRLRTESFTAVPFLSLSNFFYDRAWDFVAPASEHAGRAH